jgi:hypothetical protein
MKVWAGVLVLLGAPVALGALMMVLTFGVVGFAFFVDLGPQSSDFLVPLSSEAVRDTGLHVPPTHSPSHPSHHHQHYHPTPTHEKPTSAPAPTGDVTIRVTDGTPFSGIEVRCASGIRERGRFEGSLAIVHDMPLGEKCVVYFKGGVPAKTDVVVGETRSCTFQGGQAQCQ